MIGIQSERGEEMALIKKQLVHELVAEEIKKMIRLKGYHKGEILPSMASLAEMYGVSRTSIREALRFLEANHVIEIVNGKGVLVKDAGSHRIQTRVFIESDKTFLLQLCDVRRGLEGKAIDLAALRATKEQIQKMEENLTIFESVRVLNGESVQADLNFHQTLYEASHNPVLYKMIASVYESFYEFWRKKDNLDSIFEDTYHFHEEILHYVKKKQPEKANSYFNQMIDVVERTIKDNF